MEGYATVEDFIYSPNAVEFVVQKSDELYNYIKENQYIMPVRELTGGFVVAYIDKNNIDKTLLDFGPAFKGAESKVLGLLENESLEASGITQMQNDPELKLTGKGVLIGIIDTGIDYLNKVFRYDDGTTKIASILDQTAKGPINHNFIIGKEYTREQINLALKSDDPYSVVPQKDTVGHGTYLASLAAGRQTDKFIGAAPDSELIIVKLAKAGQYYLDKYCVPENQENAYSSASVMDGIEYVVKKAGELERPVIICLGLGTNFGSRNSFSVFEQYITHISQEIGVCVCVATGNESQAGHHFSGKLTYKAEIQPVQITVGENVHCVFMSFWGTLSDLISVSVRSPHGEQTERIQAKPFTKYTTRFNLYSSVSSVEYYFPTRVTGGENIEIIIKNPSPGIWTLLVYGDVVQIGDYHVYLPMTGFVDPSVKFVSPDPYYTTTIPATALGIINCGAYDTRNNTLFADSSWGPSSLNIISPDICAPGVNVLGVYPDGFGVKSGTSVAIGNLRKPHSCNFRLNFRHASKTYLRNFLKTL